MEAETIKAFRMTLAEPKLLKDSIAITSELLQEVNLKVKPDSIELVAMDPANVAMVVLKLYSSIFTEYNVATEMTIGLNLSNLKQILKRSGANDILTLEFEENMVNLRLRGATDRTFKMPIIDVEEKEQKVPQLNFPIKVVTNSILISEAIEDISIVSEATTFTLDSAKLVISGQGDTSNATVEIPADENTKISATPNEISSKYSIEYLKKMVGGAKLSEIITLQFNKDYPLRIDFAEQGKFELSFILAPRVEND